MVYTMGEGSALRFAVRELESRGVKIAQTLDERVTHLLLPVPTKELDVEKLPQDVTVVGGNLTELPEKFKRIDLLRDEQYLAENAALTADCALRLLGN